MTIYNCLSIDVEGFIESNIESFAISNKYININRENHEIDINVNVILDVLDKMNTKGTFFFLGRIANDIPHLIRKTADEGHEVGCHSYEHHRIYGIDKKSFKEKLSAAKKTLEDISGQRVAGFRAPDFSIIESSKWALDILREIGFLYDSSIYPIDIHDVYGIKNAKPYIYSHLNGLVEFPLSTFAIMGKRLPFGGGGYFRLYPLFFTRYLTSKMNRSGLPCMFYIHPYEVGPQIPIIKEISFYRKFRHYYNCAKGLKRLSGLLQRYEFKPAIEILQHMNFIKEKS